MRYDKGVRGALGRMGRQLEREANGMRAKPEEIVSILREEIQNYDTRFAGMRPAPSWRWATALPPSTAWIQAVYGELVELDTGVKGHGHEPGPGTAWAWSCWAAGGVREGTVVRRTGQGRRRSPWATV